ncbi:MAG: CRTAC1 family protein [Deltaproteobacteria bacterium]|nr:CRTAC1 family protein [Deltaproteobacteria bacterium]
MRYNLLIPLSLIMSLLIACSDSSSKDTNDASAISDAEISDIRQDIVSDVQYDISGDTLNDTISDISDTENDITDGGSDTSEPSDIEYICKRQIEDANSVTDIKSPTFSEKSEAMNLKEKVTGIRLASVDLDNDNYPDLIVHKVNSNTRDDFSKTPPYFQKRILLNKMREGKGFQDFTFESKFGQIRGEESNLARASSFAIAADVNNDGNLDLFSGVYTNLASDANPKDPGDRSEILLNDGNAHFSLAPSSNIFREGATVTSATFLDYDRDGNIDLFVGAFYKIWGFLESFPDRLFKGDGNGNFIDVTEQMGLLTPDDSGFEEGLASAPTYGVTSCDINNDGNPELMTSVYGRQWNKFWLFDGVKYTEIGREINYAGDSNLDYSDNEFYKCYCKKNPDDQVYCPPTVGQPRIQCGDYWAFGIDDQPFRLNGNTFSSICADVDNDGLMDIIHTEIRHWHIGQSSDPTQLLRNVIADNIYGFYFDRIDNKTNGLERKWGVTDWNEGDISGAVFDFNNDGLPDIFIASSDYPGDRAFLFRQKPDHTFTEVAVSEGIAHKQSQEITVADFDRDGDLDVIVGSSTMRNSDWKDNYVYYYENKASENTNAIEIKLVGKKGKSNLSAIGARIRVKSGELVQYKQVQGGYGHFGLQNDLVLHFGLGDKCNVDEIEIIWPDKDQTRQKITNIYANYLIEITQGEAPKYLIPLK